MNERAEAEYQAEHVRAALAGDPRVNELGITVTIAGGKVFLTGMVATAERQRSISIVVAEILPGYEIRNDVTVQELAGGSEPETFK